MPVVYDGVRGDGEGDLFRGLKLWISHRVPQRSRWVDLVKGNGGEVVQLEKKADMLIADNIKRGGAAPPAGSYTWQWIDYSVKNRFLQPKDDYLITAAAEPRAVGSSAPAKGTRTPFTNHDDLILTKFVLAKEMMGQSIKGNEIFKELERKNPRHPWQSWRDRWIKNLSSRSRPALSSSQSHPDVEARGSPQPPKPAARSPEPGRPSERGQPAQSAREPETRQAEPPRAPSVSQRRPKGRVRNFFTEEEDDLLLEYIREAQEHNLTATSSRARALSGNKIYQEFADKHPSHTWHAWRDRWLRHLSYNNDEISDAIDPQQAGEAVDKYAEEQRPQPRKNVNGHTTVPPSPAAAGKTTTQDGHAKATGAKRAAVPTPETPSTTKRPKALTDDERLERREQAKRKTRAAKLLQRTWRGFVGRRDIARFETLVVPLQSLVRGYLVRMREAETLLQASDEKDQMLQAEADDEDDYQYEDAKEEPEINELSPAQSTLNPRSARDQFYDDLQIYIDVSGAEVDRQPVVDGRNIDLWDLFRAATGQKCNAEERNWKAVADELGFDWVKSAQCLPRLWECYIRNLSDFEEAVKSYDNPEGEDEDGDEDGEWQEQEQRMEAARDEESLPPTSDAVTEPKELFAAPSSQIYRSSPPIAGIKRSFRHADVLSSDLGYPSDSSRKRRRIDQRTEIPPTPEDKLGSTKGLAEGRDRALDNSSPLKSRGVVTAQLTEDGATELLEGGMEGTEGIDELPEYPHAPKLRFVEPETRKSGFAIGGDADIREAIERGDYVYITDEGEDEGEDGDSPSQQLYNESDAISNPVPPRSSRQDAVPSMNRRASSAQISRPAVSRPAFIAVKAGGVASGSSGLLNGKTTRRSLPQTYQKPSASAPVRTFSVPPSHAMQAATPRAKHATPSTPTPGMPSSSTLLRPSSKGVYTSTAPPLPQFKRDVPNSAHSPSFDNDPAVIDAQFAHFQALGYENAHIGRAMEAATFQRGPMTVALQSLHEGRGLPQREAGVWTDDDDQKLKAVRDYDRRMQKGKFASGTKEEDERQRVRIERYRTKLTAKHGKWMEPRLQFMDMMDGGT